ncbi:MAG: 2-amino-4-hydroxy-6-hydroxymethyldihydropteridine diphosphokinase [Sphingosinicella sp.]|nr:2-amino-4-hydroxy-6-hydroxymethyldihydropteridine diphosphokinase [Sphingosinicella sp.]
MPKTDYAIALGSNRRHGNHGSPRGVIRAAAAALAGLGPLKGFSTVRSTPAMGPAGRGFANAAIILSSKLGPLELLRRLKEIERDFGRRAGRRWGPRVIDLDIILWSGGSWAGEGLIVPHPEMHRRRFVLDPLSEIAPLWRDPISGLTLRQIQRRLAAPTPVDRNRPSA